MESNVFWWVAAAAPRVASGKRFQLGHIASQVSSSCSLSVVNLKFGWLSLVDGGGRGGGVLTVNQTLPFVERKEQEIRQEGGRIGGER